MQVHRQHETAARVLALCHGGADLHVCGQRGGGLPRVHRAGDRLRLGAAPHLRLAQGVDRPYLTLSGNSLCSWYGLFRFPGTATSHLCRGGFLLHTVPHLRLAQGE